MLSFDKIKAKCGQCQKSRPIYYCSYKTNCSKNDGLYICHKCKTKGQTIKLCCGSCNMWFEIAECKARKHKNRRRFCSVRCSKIYARRQMRDARANGKRCSRCGQVKSVKEFAWAAIGKKNPRPNKLYQYCRECKKRYRMMYHN